MQIDKLAACVYSIYMNDVYGYIQVNNKHFLNCLLLISFIIVMFVL